MGALIADIQQPIVLITPEGREEEVVTRLARVGYDHTLGFLEGGIKAWKAAGKETDNIRSITADELAQRLEKGLDGTLLDVRKPTEFLAQHAEAATNFPLDYLNKNMDRLDRNATYYLHCQGGYRSMISASILKARGFHQLVDIQKGWVDIEKSSIAKTAYACPTSLAQETIDEAVAAVV